MFFKSLPDPNRNTRNLMLAAIVLNLLAMAANLTGCADVRAKRASSMVCVKLSTAADEFKAAATPEAKVKVAQQYFETAGPLVNIVDDYLHGRKPAEPAVTTSDQETKP